MAMTILDDGRDNIIRQAVTLIREHEGPVTISSQASAQGADPKVAIGRHVERADGRAG